MITTIKLSISLLLMISALPNASASEQEEKYIEFADIVLNIEHTPGTDRAYGYALATACSTCQAVRIEIDQTTELRLNGDLVSAQDLGFKIDWQGAVFFMPSKPPVATRLMLQ